jgi:solute carrier family 8 (sodium/calcium exchanger)
MIGAVTAIVGEYANLFGCVMGVKPSITAITFVALGTSLPDTFASMAAAQAEKYADAAVGNVTGSNSVNVFLGLGLPWVIAVAWSAGFTPAKGPGGAEAWEGLK